MARRVGLHGYGVDWERYKPGKYWHIYQEEQRVQRGSQPKVIRGARLIARNLVGDLDIEGCRFNRDPHDAKGREEGPMNRWNLPLILYLFTRILVLIVSLSHEQLYELTKLSQNSPVHPFFKSLSPKVTLIRTHSAWRTWEFQHWKTALSSNPPVQPISWGWTNAHMFVTE